MNCIKEAERGLDLVGLQVADHVPGDFAAQVAEGIGLLLGFLDAVLADVTDAGFDCLADGVWTEALGDGDECDVCWIAAAALAGSGYPAADVFDALGDGLGLHGRQYKRRLL